MKNNEKIAIKVSIISIILNCLLTLIKFISGVISKSSAMISDSVHSLSDVLSTFVVIIGVKISNKKADSDHPYGHERVECVSAIILSGMLFVVGALIGINGIKNVTNSSNLVMPGVLALIASIISIISKEAMYQYTIRVSKKINSAALKADAWHHRSDALSSIGSKNNLRFTELRIFLQFLTHFITDLFQCNITIARIHQTDIERDNM